MTHTDENTQQDRARAAQRPENVKREEIPTAEGKAPENAAEEAARPVIMTLYVADCRGNAQNVTYKHEIRVKNEQDLQRALKRDHMAGRMVSSYRHTDNFIECDCIMLDVDNTHTEDPDKWKSADDIAEALPVNYYLVRSRNYMKPKSHTDKKTGYTITAEPREKWHIYAPLAHRITRRADHEQLIKNVVALFPFIDISAIDAARFFYGVEAPHITPEGGECYIDEYIANYPAEELRSAQIDALNDYVKHIKDGSYKDNKASRTTVNTICELLNISNPLPEPGQDQAAPAADQTDNDAPEWMLYAEQAEAEQWLINWTQAHGVKLGRRYTFKRAGDKRSIAYCVSCPWEEEHTPGKYPDNEAAIFIEQDGKISFKCRHSHGAALNWRKYRAYYEAKAPQEPQQEPQEGQESPAPVPGDYLTEFFNRISGEDYKPYKTGLPFFDNLLNGGPVKKTMLLLLAAPAAGKTTLCQQIAESMSEHGKPVLYVNLEMSREQMIAKSMSARCTLAGEPMTTLEVLQGYNWTPKQREAVKAALDQYRERVAPRLDYNPDGVTGDLEKLSGYLDAIGERAKAAGRPGPVIVIDYLHLLTWPGEDTANVIKKSMEILKNYAMNYDTISIAISATNRDSNRAGRITMESGRDSSGIEYTGDYILSLNYYQVDQGDVKTSDNDKMGILASRPWRQMILRVLKSRFSPPGRPARVYFHAAGNRFYAEDDFLPADQNIIHFGDPDTELNNAGVITTGATTEDILQSAPGKTPKAGRKR